MSDLTARARALSRHEHDDASIGDECAAEIERLTDDYAAATHLLADRDAQIERLTAELATLRAAAASVQADQRAEIDAAKRGWRDAKTGEAV